MQDIKTRQLNLKVFIAELALKYPDSATHYAKAYPVDEEGKFQRLNGFDEFYGTGRSEEEALKDCIHSLFEGLKGS